MPACCWEEIITQDSVELTEVICATCVKYFSILFTKTRKVALTFTNHFEKQKQHYSIVQIIVKELINI